MENSTGQRTVCCTIPLEGKAALVKVYESTNTHVVYIEASRRDVMNGFRLWQPPTTNTVWNAMDPNPLQKKN